jgi:hypothetical protein
MREIFMNQGALLLLGIVSIADLFISFLSLKEKK